MTRTRRVNASPALHARLSALARRRLALGLAALALGSSGAFVFGCRKDAPTASDGVGAPATSAVADGGAAATERGAAPDGEGSSDDAPARLRALVGGRRDAGDVDPACEGVELSLLAAAVDARCAISDTEWAALTRPEDGANGSAGRGAPAGGAAVAPRRDTAAARQDAVGLRQEARREGDRIVVSIVNGGAAPLVVPLRYHPGRPELAFSVLAESDARALYELAPPSWDAPLDGSTRRDAGDARRAPLLRPDGGPAIARVHTALIRLAPGGAARARLAIDPRIVKRLDRRCGDAGDVSPPDGGGLVGEGRSRDAGAPDGCLPARLAAGRVVLHVGQLVAAIDAGEPARVAWDVP
ncbi:MAG: hypothetical protein KF782_31180 [Labilithrix sp.]|nr:hypothetical protein [Labilithrix sp.]